ncbi:hypothetical protein QE390_002999 [Siphonobacter sp. SORGH_AS 1065]|nr:hypothetical protein [Siphonobacter sp. SORGH_AS_1065]
MDSPGLAIRGNPAGETGNHTIIYLITLIYAILITSIRGAYAMRATDSLPRVITRGYP